MLAGTTGLRRNELLSLTWDDINLSGDNAFVRAKACTTKNGKEALQPIPPMVVSLLMALKATVKPQGTDRVFPSFGRWINTAGLIRDDLTTAAMPLIDREKSEICFHSLRNSFISFLANSQAPAKVIQKLARHSDPRMTFNLYARTFEESEQKAISFLPNIGNFIFSQISATSRTDERIMLDSSGQENSQDIQKNAILADNHIAPRGFEPLLPG
jgi:integrase